LIFAAADAVTVRTGVTSVSIAAIEEHRSNRFRRYDSATL
jgi:hypothetical protein